MPRTRKSRLCGLGSLFHDRQWSFLDQRRENGPKSSSSSFIVPSLIWPLKEEENGASNDCEKSDYP